MLAREPLSCSRCRLSWSCAMRRSRVLRRGWAGSWSFPENDSLYNSRLHVLLLDQDGAKVKPGSGRGRRRLDLADARKRRPDRLGARRQGGLRSVHRGRLREQGAVSLAGQADGRFGFDRAGVRAWRGRIASCGWRRRHSGRYDLDLEQGHDRAALRRSSSPGRPWRRFRRRESLLVMTFQDQRSGGVALWAIDPDSNAIVWKTIVGAPWAASPIAGAVGRAFADRPRRPRGSISMPSELGKGGFVDRGGAASRANFRCRPAGGCEFDQPARRSRPSCPKDGSNQLWVQDPAKPGHWQKVALPVAMAARADRAGETASASGPRCTRVPRSIRSTARASAEPFVPKFDRDHQGSWLPPAAVDCGNGGPGR